MIDIAIKEQKEIFDKVWENFKENDQTTNTLVLLVLIDAVAAQDGRKGYELIDEVLPIMRVVGDELGVIEC